MLPPARMLRVIEATTSKCESLEETTPWLGLQSNNYDSIQGEWVQTITEENMYPVGVRLRPLWELLDHADMDPAQAEELKNYMMRPRN